MEKGKSQSVERALKQTIKTKELIPPKQAEPKEKTYWRI